MTGRLLLVGSIAFVLIMALVGMIGYKEAKENVPQVALINGIQTYFATVKYPTTSNLPKLPVKVTLSLHRQGETDTSASPPLVVVDHPEPGDPEKFDIKWDTRKTPDGEYVVMIKAYWGDQIIGLESRRVQIVN